MEGTSPHQREEKDIRGCSCCAAAAGTELSGPSRGCLAPASKESQSGTNNSVTPSRSQRKKRCERLAYICQVESCTMDSIKMVGVMRESKSTSKKEMAGDSQELSVTHAVGVARVSSWETESAKISISCYSPSPKNDTWMAWKSEGCATSI